MITSSGPKCDVCGKYILPVLDEVVHEFVCKGIERTLFCCTKCKPILYEAKNWEELPKGPLREAFEEAHKILESNGFI